MKGWRTGIVLAVLAALVVWGVYDIQGKKKKEQRLVQEQLEKQRQFNEEKEAARKQLEKEREEKKKAGLSDGEGTAAERELSDGDEEVEFIMPSVGLNQGDLAPDFTLMTLDGEETTLSDHKGKKIILNIWASWCPPCKAEMPDMQRFYEEYGGKDSDFEILAVNLTASEKKLEDVQNFAEEYNITFPILLDDEEEVAYRYQVSSIPSTFILNENGEVDIRFIGPMNFEMMERMLEIN